MLAIHHARAKKAPELSLLLTLHTLHAARLQMTRNSHFARPLDSRDRWILTVGGGILGYSGPKAGLLAASGGHSGPKVTKR